MERCSSDLKGLNEVKLLFGSTVVENVIEIHYCASKGGCVPFLGVSGIPLLPTDFFDTRQGFHLCRKLAAFIKLHNAFIDEVLIATQCEMPNPTPADKFAVPDILTHQSGRTEFYEIKPLGTDGIRKGREKINKFKIFCSLNSIQHYLPGIQYSPNEDRPITTQIWLGTPAKFRFRFVRTEPGLILWDICIETSTEIVVEAVWKSMFIRLIIALLFLAPEVVPVLTLARTNLEAETGTLVALSGSVGQGGTNNTADVQAVQLLLNDWRANNGRELISMDGLIGPLTISAIKDFQKSVTGISDGRVDPTGSAIAALERAHLLSLVAPDLNMVILDPYMLAVLSQLSPECFEKINEPEMVEGTSVAQLEQMVRAYFLELRNG
ncbi:peptidoglycan-binding domain-containing protein [Cytobacillus firmus]|uniref:peptidoglycan-binding domain-containing protein n=1 Tax=Cytobacillus firmus TaxID=1399 RepID=UPI0018CE9E68|nr:peptidoglycan-binding domain-containing protein [Cytobacillus firmus]MBG9447256.1 hypothetical protein [Cytobacillus firmus]